MKYDPDMHHRRSVRLKGYDYTRPGAYFITLCTYQRDELLGAINNGKMYLSALGELVHKEWFRSAAIRNEIQLFDDEFVIMPNHLHGIVWIVATVGADGVRPNDGMGTRRVPLQRSPKSLGSFIAGFKASVTSRAKREWNMTAIWQRNYYEHVIRDETDFNNIWDYLETNPLHWQEDQLHPSVPPNNYNQK